MTESPNQGTSFLDYARELLGRAEAYARQEGTRMAVVVVDITFTPVALFRMDGAFPSTVAVASAKAMTSLNFGAPTRALRERIAPENQTALANVDARLMFVGGGLPIRQGGKVVGAIGVSGGSEEQDHQCALHALGEQN